MTKKSNQSHDLLLTGHEDGSVKVTETTSLLCVGNKFIFVRVFIIYILIVHSMSQTLTRRVIYLTQKTARLKIDMSNSTRCVLYFFHQPGFLLPYLQLTTTFALRCSCGTSLMLPCAPCSKFKRVTCSSPTRTARTTAKASRSSFLRSGRWACFYRRLFRWTGLFRCYGFLWFQRPVDSIAGLRCLLLFLYFKKASYSVFFFGKSLFFFENIQAAIADCSNEEFNVFCFAVVTILLYLIVYVITIS